MGLPTLLVMCALLGGGSLAVGSIPLSFALSKTHLSRLSALGTGLLLGAALGIIIPEGIETLSSAHPGSPPTSQIALCLISGFTFMLVLEQLAHAHSGSAHKHHALPMHSRPDSVPGAVTVDAEIDAMERELEADQQARQNGARRPSTSSTNSMQSMTFIPGDDYDGTSQRSKKAAFPLTLGLVMHALADGLALGSSALTGDGGHPAHGHAEGGGVGEGLSVVVFLALLVHKAPTALALTTSLLAGSLPRADCKKHLLVFSLSTPLGAMLTYAIFSILGSQGGLDGLAGGALLVSGGTFLYVATVLQPVSHSAPAHDDVDNAFEEEDGAKTRVAFVVVGIFLPYIIGSVLGHGH